MKRVHALRYPLVFLDRVLASPPSPALPSRGREPEEDMFTAGPDSFASALIFRNASVPARSHHSNSAASVVVIVAPDDSIRRSAIS
jgi:hypothetical protein